MRALFFAYYFPPLGGIGSIRALSLARHLPGFGVDVTVIAPRTGTYALDPSLAVPPDMDVVRTGTLEPTVLLGRGGAVGGSGSGSGLAGARGLRAGLRRLVHRLIHVPDPNIGWVPAAVRAGLIAARRVRPDVVLSSSPPLSAHIAAAITARRIGRPLVLDIRDFFETQRLHRGLRDLLDRAIEDRVLGAATGITSPTGGILDDIRARRALPSLLVRNGYEEADFESPAPEPPARFRLVHIGTTYGGRKSPAALFRAVRTAVARGADLRLRFVGKVDGTVLSVARETGIADRCEFVGFVTHAEAIAELRAASALLLFIWAGEETVSRGAMAGKTLEYLRSGRPVLAVAAPGSETARFLAKLGGAVVVDHEAEAAAADALTALARGEKPAPARVDDLREWSREEQARRLASWLTDLRSRRGTVPRSLFSS